MQLIQKITLDFAENGIPPKIFGKQDDSGASRAVVISLYNAGVAFAIPAGAAFMMRYKTPSGAYGLYDTMPDGSAAMTAEENRVTVQLVDQIFAAPGRVSCELRIIADGAGVSTWKWYVDVEGSNAADATIPSDYINVLTNLASEVAANASRAEQAASQIVPESLLHKEDYDPTGAVQAAGGIQQYVENNRLSLSDSVSSDSSTTAASSAAVKKAFNQAVAALPTATQFTLSVANDADYSLSSQYNYYHKFGSIVFVEFSFILTKPGNTYNFSFGHTLPIPAYGYPVPVLLTNNVSPTLNGHAVIRALSLIIQDENLFTSSAGSYQIRGFAMYRSN